jgi:hypothetical protein
MSVWSAVVGEHKIDPSGNTAPGSMIPEFRNSRSAGTLTVLFVGLSECQTRPIFLEIMDG